jgi:hypothetical protein
MCEDPLAVDSFSCRFDRFFSAAPAPSSSPPPHRQIMMNSNASLGLVNYTGLPFVEPLGVLEPCWPLPNTAPGFDQHKWCGPIPSLRLPCFYAGTCNVSSGGGVSFYWNYSAPGVADWRVADNVAFVRAGGSGVDGLFTDEMEMFPGECVGAGRRHSHGGGPVEGGTVH